MLIRGSCHCQNLSFALDWPGTPAEIPARACTCSFCSKHAGVWTSHPEASLRIAIARPALASTYAFATQTAQFHLCTRCGVAPVATSRIDGRLFAVVNVNTFDGIEPSLVRVTPSSLDEEDMATRLARRQRHWIGSVTFAQACT